MAPPKKTQQKMSLGSFLQDETLGSWAEEMEDTPIPSSDSRTGYGNRSASTNTGFNSYQDRGFSVREELPLPSKPPYTAHIGNLSFDSTEGDIQDYFQACQVTNVRIVEDRIDRKPKGFGYVEFGSVEGLKTALTLNGTNFNGRNIRVSVAEPPKDRPEAREFNDWTRKGPLPDLPNSNQRRVASERTFGAPRNFDNSSDAGSERGDRRRSPFAQDDGKVRDLGNWERKGPLQSAGPAPPSRDGDRSRFNDKPRDRRSSPQWGGSQDGSRPPRREFQEKPHVERTPTASELDNQWRARMRPDPPVISRTPSREPSVPSSPAASVAPLAATKPAGRPKLNLAKRTVSEADPNQSPATAGDSKSSPFGAARPIDTQAREKEVEEKRELALKQKKEEEKAREEKKRAAKEAKEATKAEKANSANAAGGEKAAEKENGTRKTFEILRKNNEETEADGSESDPAGPGEESANGEIVEDKSVKPKEVVRDIPPKKTEGNNWRKASEKKAAPPAESTTKALEDDGWSTVQKTKNNRKSNQTTRAIAS